MTESATAQYTTIWPPPDGWLIHMNEVPTSHRMGRPPYFLQVLDYSVSNGVVFMPDAFTCRPDPRAGWTQCQFDSATGIIFPESPANAGVFGLIWGYYNSTLPVAPNFMDVGLQNAGYNPGAAGHTSDSRHVVVGINMALNGFPRCPYDPPHAKSDPLASAIQAVGPESGLGHELAHASYIEHNGNGGAGNWRHEFIANASEYVGGTRYAVHSPCLNSYDYDISFVPNFFPQHSDASEACGVACKYDEYSILGVYLSNPLFLGLDQDSPLDDLRRGWALANTAPIGTQTQFDFWGLKTYLDPDNLPPNLMLHYATLFQTEDPTLRVNRFFNWYGLARYVNNPSPTFYEGRYGFPSGITTYDNFPLFRDTAPTNHVRATVVPPEIILGSGFLASGSGTLEGDWHDPVDGSTDPTLVRTWGTDYVVIRVNEAEYAGVACKRPLVVSVESDGPVPVGHRIWVNYVTYSLSAPELFTQGANATAVVTELGAIENGTFHAQFNIDRFGDQTKSVVLSITSMRSPLLSDEGAYDPTKSPRDCHYKVHYALGGTVIPAVTHISAATTWNSATSPIYLSGALYVEPGASLVIENATVRMDPSAAVPLILVDGSLTATNCTFESCGTDRWDGIAITGNASATLTNCSISGARVGVSAGTSGTVTVNRCRIFDASDYGIAAQSSGVVTINNSRITVPAVDYAQGIHMSYGGSPVYATNDTVLCLGNVGVVGVHCETSSQFHGVRVENAGNGTGFYLWGADSTSVAILDSGCRAKDCKKGVVADNRARPALRHCKITGGYYGVYAGSLSVPDLGQQWDYGNNTIFGATSKLIYRAKPQIFGIPRVPAYGNYFGPDSVLASWFSLSVDYNPYQTTDPNLGLMAAHKVEIAPNVPESRPSSKLTIRVLDNPFASSTVFDLRVPSGAVAGHAERAAVDLFDSTGRHIVSFGEVVVDHEGVAIQWNGLDSMAREAANGMYFLRAATPHGVVAAKVLKARY